MEKFLVELVTPSEVLFSTEVEMVVVPGTEGVFGVLSGHAPVISSIKPGVIEIHKQIDNMDKAYVSSGVVEVVKDRCTILVEKAVDLGKTSVKQAQEALDAAKKDLAVEHKPERKASLEAKVEMAENILKSLKETK